jgi:5-methylcytosine-specific restriction endonuclease McrA
VDLVVLMRLCPKCGVLLDQAEVPRGPCDTCRRTHERERSRARRAESKAVRARNSRAWQLVREAAKQRDHNRCIRCGSTERLEVHHRIPIEQGGSALALDNLATLCVPCHRKEEGVVSTGVFLRERASHPRPERWEKETQNRGREMKSGEASPRNREISLG